MKSQGIELVYWRSASSVDESEIEQAGGMLVDEKLTYVISLSDKHRHHNQVENYHEDMSLEKLKNLAIQSSVYSRFSIDKNIPTTKARDLYRLWMLNSINKKIASEVLVLTESRKVAGMLTLGEKCGRGDIGLVAVDEAFRGKKYGKSLVESGLNWFANNGYQQAQVVTQAANVPACNLYEKCGFALESREYFYHFWL